MTILTSPELEDQSVQRDLELSFPDRETGPLYGHFGRSYYPATMASPPQDRSFVVTVGARPVLLVDCDVANQVLGRYGLPARLWPAVDLDPTALTTAMTHAFRALDRIASDAAVDTVRVVEPVGGSVVSNIGKRAIDRGARPSLVLQAEVDLTLEERDIHRSIRKSFKPLINKGRKQLVLEYLNAEQPDWRRFERMKRFHRAVAGRTTRSDESWLLQYRSICQGFGEVTLATDLEDGELVAATMVIDGEDEAVYFSAVYDRDRFHKPLAHWPLYEAALRAKNRKRKRFILGTLPRQEESSEKEEKIGYFKRGFATELTLSLVWEWSPS